ncbi:MAG: indole-3-glycerol-phosphate synthase [Thermoanaerobaculia bacterium]|nr:indole-3-glycerol-phosphate synthase [Thermoanaerobaculia bacterium]
MSSYPATRLAGTDASSSELPDILVRIVRKRAEVVAVARGKETYTEPPRREVFQDARENRFTRALAEKAGRAIIAEVKMGSPSLGSLEGTFDSLEQARAYGDTGAAALSVVVEPDFFHGSYELLARCVRASGLPAIAKDFVIDPLQLRWARRAGASAVLLIAALYTAQELRAYARLARRHRLVPLIETHDEADVAKLAGMEWEVVGVNNRDLRTFDVSLNTSESLVSRLPEDAMKVAESGIHSADDRRRLADVGYDAFLIGEALVKSGDPRAKLRELLD